MAQPKPSVSSRIRHVKSSLDSAERSFRDNKDIRGELDLMLAEAELENLRRKKNVPWNWNRQLLAGFFAVMLVAAGACGWYFAKDSGAGATVAEERPLVTGTGRQEASPKAKEPAFAADSEQASGSLVAKAAEEPEDKVKLTRSDMRRLVQSARIELNSSQ